MTYLAESVEDVVEVNQYLTLGYLCDVVHSLTGIVTNPCILIRETRKHWRDNRFEVFWQFLRGDGGMSSCHLDRNGKTHGEKVDARQVRPTDAGGLHRHPTGRETRNGKRKSPTLLTDPRAIAAAARPIRPPFRA